MLKQQNLAIKQGLPKKHTHIKTRMLRRQMVDSLSTNVLSIGVSSNAWYGIQEIQTYFHALISKHCSGNLGVDLIYDFRGFNVPDQETVMRRCEKLTYTKKLSERLKELIDAYENSRINDQEYFEGLQTLREEIYNRDQIAKQLGLTPIEFPFYNLLMDRIDSGISNDVVVEFAKKMVETIEGKTV